MPVDTGVKLLKYDAYLHLRRYECSCGEVWANDLQKKYNQGRLDKLHDVVYNNRGGWYA